MGRRRVLLFTILAYIVLTGATAFSPNAAMFVVSQFFARTFAVAESLLAVVVIVEEFDPDVRGWGIGAARGRRRPGLKPITSSRRGRLREFFSPSST